MKKEPKVVKKPVEPKTGGWPIKMVVSNVRLVGDPAPYVGYPCK